jgi:hypothetical protein
MSIVASLGSAITLHLTRGVDHRLRFTLTTLPIGALEFEAVDLTSASVTLTVRTSVSGTQVISLVNGPGDHVDDAAGVTDFTIPRAAFDDLPASGSDQTRLAYEVRRTDVDDEASPAATLEYVHAYGTLVLVATAAPDAPDV